MSILVIVAAEFDNKISPDIIDSIDTAGALEEAEFEAAIRVKYKHAEEAAAAEGLDGSSSSSPVSTPLRARPIELPVKRAGFDIEAAMEFLESGYLSWGQSPKELINWLVEQLSAGNQSISEMCFALQSENPPTPQTVYYGHFVEAITKLTHCGLLHTDSREDPTGRDLYPTEVYYVNYSPEAQRFVMDLTDDELETQPEESLNSNVDPEALADLESLMSSRASLTFNDQTGLKGFLEQFNTEPGEYTGTGQLLKRLNDFSISTRSLIEHAVQCAAIAGILETNKDGLYRLNNEGRKLLEQ